MNPVLLRRFGTAGMRAAMLCLLATGCGAADGDMGPAWTSNSAAIGGCADAGRACSCPGGALAAVACGADGVAFCQCPGFATPDGLADVGQIGAGGMVGTGGMTAGAGGMTAGAGGMTAGAGGMTAGAGGMAGSGGMASTGGMAGTGGMEIDPPPVDDGSIPSGDHCAPVAGWDGGWAQWEHEVLLLVNEERAVGGNCGGEAFAPSGPLTANPSLRCAARLHSEDMHARGYFDHNNPSGQDPFVRMEDAGYRGRTMGENIAKGQRSPSEVVDAWMQSTGHCKNILNGGFSELGVGYFRGEEASQWGNIEQHYWTQNFGG